MAAFACSPLPIFFAESLGNLKNGIAFVAVHGVAGFIEVCRIAYHPGFLAGIDVAGQLAAERSAVMIHHHHLDISHHLRIVNQRVDYRIGQGEKYEEKNYAQVVCHKSELAAIHVEQLSGICFYLIPHRRFVLGSIDRAEHAALDFP